MSFEYHFAVEDPAYGTRVFRRRIRIEKRGTHIVAGLEDFMHACKLVVGIEKGIVTSIDGTWYRHPNLSCRGAVGQLQRFVGKPVTADRIALRDYADVRQQCTHFHDLLGFVMRHALRDVQTRQYDVALPDLVGATSIAEVQLDGVTMHRWEIDRSGIVGPSAVAGKPLEKGFSRWAGEMYAGDALEAAHVLQMGIFVSRAGHLDFPAMKAKFPGVVLAPPSLIGVCYALQPERAHEALPCHDVRDFTHAATRMVKFL